MSESKKITQWYDLDKMVSVVLVINLIVFALSFIEKPQTPFLGVFSGQSPEVSTLLEALFLLFYAFILRGPHGVLTWWSIYGNKKFLIKNHDNFQKKFLLYPLFILLLSFVLFFYLGFSQVENGFFWIIFIALAGPLYSYHVISQDYGVLNLLIRKKNKGSLLKKKILTLKKGFRVIYFFDLLSFSLPALFLILSDTVLKPFLMYLLYATVVGGLFSVVFLWMLVRGRQSEFSKTQDYYWASLALEFLARLVMVFFFGSHFLFYMLRVVRHGFIYFSLVYKDFNSSLEGTMHNWLPGGSLGYSSFYFLTYSFLAGFLFSIMYCVLLMPLSFFEILIPKVYVEAIPWFSLKVISAIGIGTFSLLHYYLDSYPWRFKKEPQRVDLF